MLKKGFYFKGECRRRRRCQRIKKIFWKVSIRNPAERFDDDGVGDHYNSLGSIKDEGSDQHYIQDLVSISSTLVCMFTAYYFKTTQSTLTDLVTKHTGRKGFWQVRNEFNTIADISYEIG